MKNWITNEADEEASLRVQEETGYPQAICRLLVSRGCSSADEIDRFINPRLSDVSDPFLMSGMHGAVERIWSAVDNDEKIVIFGDYDVDGITSTALLYKVLKALGASPCTFIPHRVDDGYGLEEESLRRCIDDYVPGLVITVDCGTGSTEAVKMAGEAGVDVIITDHHEPTGDPAPAHAIINPKLGAPEAAISLAGVGVVFKLCHALVKTGRDRGHPPAGKLDLRGYLNMVALGTVVDMAPLKGENRVLVRHGINDLNAGCGPGLSALKHVGGVSGPVDTYHLGFVIGPRLNAAGRMGTAESALKLLLCEDDESALDLAKELDGANRERQEMEARMVEEACEEIDASFKPEHDFGLVVARDGWHPGVIGIVASRLTGRYNRPVVVIGFDDKGEGKGSCRSFASFNLVKGLAECEQHLLAYGGHEQAAGLRIERSSLEAFRRAFNEAAGNELRGTDLRPQLKIDGWIGLSEIDDWFMSCLDTLAPFGIGNSKPVWAARNIGILGQPRVVGRGHLKLLLASGGAQYEAIGFRMGDRQIPDGPMEIAFRLDRNVYKGRETIQLILEDFRAS